MAKLTVNDLTGAKVGDIDVSDDVFGVEIREHLLWEAVRVQRAARRQGTASTKTRAEVNRTKDKIYRQKGTGSARHGSRRANVFRGGGVVHGPRPHLYHLDMNKKAMAAALRVVLSLRASKGNLIVVKELTGSAPKTKELATALAKLESPKALLVCEEGNRWLQLSARNLEKSAFLDVRGLNVYDIMRYPKLVMSEASLRALEARLAKKSGEASPKEAA
jgi:large subunit ribosomal protein L4